MNIRRAAAASGLTPDTIRFYEREGVLPPAPRKPNGYRDYSEQHTDTLRLARGLREIGLPLVEMREALAVASEGNCGDLRDTLRETLRHALTETERRLDDLQRAREQLSGLLTALDAVDARNRRAARDGSCACFQIVEIS